MIPPEMARQLEILGYTDQSKVRVRCFVAKGMPLDEQVKRGAAWQRDEKTIIPIPIEGWLDTNGVFTRLKKKRCDDKVELDSNDNPIWSEAKTYQNGIGYLRTINAKGYGIYLIPNSGGGAGILVNVLLTMGNQITRCTLIKVQAQLSVTLDVTLKIFTMLP